MSITSFGLLVMLAAPHATSGSVQFVQVESLRARAAPQPEGALLGKLPVSAAVRVLEVRGDWSRVAPVGGGGDEAWVASRFLGGRATTSEAARRRARRSVRAGNTAAAIRWRRRAAALDGWPISDMKRLRVLYRRVGKEAAAREMDARIRGDIAMPIARCHDGRWQLLGAVRPQDGAWVPATDVLLTDDDVTARWNVSHAEGTQTMFRPAASMWLDKAARDDLGRCRAEGALASRAPIAHAPAVPAGAGLAAVVKLAAKPRDTGALVGGWAAARAGLTEVHLTRTSEYGPRVDIALLTASGAVVAGPLVLDDGQPSALVHWVGLGTGKDPLLAVVAVLEEDVPRTHIWVVRAGQLAGRGRVDVSHGES